MEDGVKEEPAKANTEVKFMGKAGWLKKSSGKILGSYKDRYIQLDKTEIVVYDNEDLENCIERLDLEHFDKCHELRSPFKKKNRLILIRAPKSGNKVSDVKLQAQSPEEKEAWIKALSDGINRAKNKIFDEVKVDESSSLEHVTRSRPKGNRGRRPPTRIHMKEAANSTTDGILRLDLEIVDNTPNGTHFASEELNEKSNTQTDATKSSDEEDSAPVKKAVKIPMPPSKENKPNEKQEDETRNKEPAVEKKVLTPPMPPSKDKKPSENKEEDKPSEEVGEKKTVKPHMPPSKENKPGEKQESQTKNEKPAAEKKVLTPPMPPSKEKKSCENKEEDKPSEEAGEKKAVKPPMPPSKENKPVLTVGGDLREEGGDDSGEESGGTSATYKPSPAQDETEDSESSKSSEGQSVPPVCPTSKDLKPEETDKETFSDDEEDKEVKDAHSDKTMEEETKAVKTEDVVMFTLSDTIPKPQGVMWDLPSTGKQDVNKSKSSETSAATTFTVEHSKQDLKSTPHSTPEAVKKSTGPPAPPKKKPLKKPIKLDNDDAQKEPVVVSNVSEQAPSEATKPVSSDPSDGRQIATPSPVNAEELDAISAPDVEEKSTDSGRLSAEGSEIGDRLTPSSDKGMQGSLQGLDLETSEDDLEPSDSNPTSTTQSVQRPNPAPETKQAGSGALNSKTRSASTGNLVDPPATPQASDVKDLQSKVSKEMKEMEELLDKLAPMKSEPEVLLTTAMEKLRKAEQFLREAKSFKELENKSNRTSW